MPHAETPQLRRYLERSQSAGRFFWGARRSALQQLPVVEDVGSAVEFLLDDGARSITGTVLTVDASSTA